MVKLDGEWAVFNFYRPQAARVHLAGDFNDWREEELPMVRTSEGYWFAKLRLPAGDFKFRYCADGEWFTDYAAFGVEPGRFGMDSIIRVPQPTLRLAPAQANENAAVAAA
jgi:1,4-alpha-glucan branching enzyme